MQSLYALKPWYTRRPGLIVDTPVQQRISPDVCTAVGFAGAAGAAVVVAFGLWLIEVYMRLLHWDRNLTLRVDGGPLDINIVGRSVLFMWVTLIVLPLAYLLG